MAQEGRVSNIEQIDSRDFSWLFWFTLPLYPFGSRRTIRKEIVKDTIWTFDQIQGIFYVVVPIRMTVVKLEAGGLLVYAPVAPTAECIRLVNELVAEHGEVQYIILPTISGLEHKVFVGPFARCFPQAQVFVAPSQWSFPLNLPLSWLGLPAKTTQILPADSQKTPFADEFDYAILGPINLGPGKFAEVAFFHKRSHTLLLTDTILSVPEEPPAIVQLDPYPLLFHAKENAGDIVVDNQANRRKGWQRISLFALYFQPSVLDVISLAQTLRNAITAPERSKKAYFGLYPFKWQSDWQRSFAALRGDGRLFVAPILQTLILNRAPQETINWANKVASWDFHWIIPCHFDSPIKAEPYQFRQAFAFLEQQPAVSAGLFNSNSYPLPQEDFKALQEIDINLNKFKIVPPPQDKV
ncbi:DUF4336 domain-containing protein [Tolypothrix sp. FACHB-123]|uniref:DUF4336 domain-containing protein n=1 Tax=Tolypothrix sp. FACHB-123 TaxID=2692868 RepID=UPI0016857DB3|nr:DUF4336 domain-containing protein [Tolypothrix sp. FACHB-123]MBD2353618.1 DUF4336 domain-containing protein [Tolypothrix sp. FACHB-123]